ncbi:MAG TPA: VOC family protein [Terriglobales bacterium]|nr:VOC family protein [Terriglobales bacterium]
MSEPPAGLLLGVFETHVQVKNLENAMRFYGDILGLELGFTVTESRAALYWVGGRGKTMLGVWEKPPWLPADAGERILPQHLAFEVTLNDLQPAIQRMKQRGIQLRNFFDQVTDEPSVFGWIPAAAIYFNDPDGHLLEFIAKLQDEPMAEVGVVSLREWNHRVQR